MHELVARSSAWQVRAAQGKAKTDSLTALRNFNYTTRANISHEIAEQIRARIVSTPARKMGGAGVGLVCALTEWSYIFLFWLLTTLGFYLVEVAETGHRGSGLCADGMGRWAKAHGWWCVAWRKNMPKSGRTY